MRKLVANYSFNAAAGTVTSPDFVDFKKILLITNITTGADIFDSSRPTLGGTLSGRVLTLEASMSGMANTNDHIAFATIDGTHALHHDVIKTNNRDIKTEKFVLRIMSD